MAKNNSHFSVIDQFAQLATFNYLSRVLVGDSGVRFLATIEQFSKDSITSVDFSLLPLLCMAAGGEFKIPLPQKRPEPLDGRSPCHAQKMLFVGRPMPFGLENRHGRTRLFSRKQVDAEPTGHLSGLIVQGHDAMIFASPVLPDPEASRVSCSVGKILVGAPHSANDETVLVPVVILFHTGVDGVHLDLTGAREHGFAEPELAAHVLAAVVCSQHPNEIDEVAFGGTHP